MPDRGTIHNVKIMNQQFIMFRRAGIMRLTVQHPGRLLRREASRQLPEQR